MRSGHLPEVLLLLPLLLPWLQLMEASLATAASSSKNRTVAIDNHSPDNELLMWSVRLQGGSPDDEEGSGSAADLDQVAQRLAEAAGLVSWGQVGKLNGVYSLVHYGNDEAEQTEEAGQRPMMTKQSTDRRRPTLAELRRRHRRLAASFAAVKLRVERLLAESAEVRWYSQEIVRPRRPRGLLDTCNDPFAAYQWHLKSRLPAEFDVNVTGVWAEGNYGSGVTVCLLDDGLDYTNPDLADAYNPRGSYDFNENDYDPMPSTSSTANHHGTRCAGEIAAKANNFYCGIGVAPSSRVSMLKILDGTVIDSMEGMAYNYQYHGNYIYSSSWGPPDTGNFIDGPHLLGRQALRNGVLNGRHGYGSIFVVASGNGGRYADNCNFDGYATSEFTVTVGAVTRAGVMPDYAEECACMHGVTVSSGGAGDVGGVGIVTTDWSLLGGTGCTSNHGGTSAAAPLAAGMAALMLSARPCLSWRDVQHILVLTAEKVDREVGHYARNGAGLFHSHRHGFGMLSAWRLVQIAKMWDSVPPALYKDSTSQLEYSQLPAKAAVNFFFDSVASIENRDHMILEHVKVYVSIDHPRRGQLTIGLFSPAGTYSVLASARPHDKSAAGLRWTFATVRCWGESPYGEWRLAVNNTSDQPGVINSWRLIFIGTSIRPEDYLIRIRQVRDIVTGKSPAPARAKACPKSSPTFTADGVAPGTGSSSARLMALLRRLPTVFNFLLLVSLCALVYYTLYSSTAWCRNKFKERRDARSYRSVTPYDFHGPTPHSSGGASSELLPPSPSLPPPPAYGSGTSDLPPSYEEAVSESTALLAHYDARSSCVSFQAAAAAPSSGSASSSASRWQPLRHPR